jgi:hypothetical protein
MVLGTFLVKQLNPKTMEKKFNTIIWLQTAILLCVVAVVIYVLYLQTPSDKSLHENFAFKINGDRIQTRATSVWPGDAAKRIVNSYSTLTMNGSAIHLQAERIHTLAINANSSNNPIKEMEELLNDCGDNSAYTYTLGAIEMFYAVVSSNFKLYYRPVVLHGLPDPRYGQGGHYYRRYDRLATGGTYYKYDQNSKSFTTEVSTINVPNAIAAYQTAIRIKRPTSNSPAPSASFYTNATHAVYGDVTSIIMPIDEFESLAKSTDEIRLWNAVEPLELLENVSGQKIDRNLIKHIIILSTDDVDEDYNNRTLNYHLTSTFSDMSHLCPPSCNADQFTFALKEVP